MKMMPIERKNVENIAEEVGVLFGASNGVVIFDDTGFPKNGDKYLRAWEDSIPVQ